MFKKIQNMAISKDFLIALIFIVLMFTSFGVSVGDAFAVDVNGSIDDMGIGLDVEDKLENSQSDVESMSISDSSDNDVLSLDYSNDTLKAGDSYTVTGGSFKKIQNAINNAKNGDTLNLNGDFYSIGQEIEVNKNLTIKSTSGSILNGKDLSRIFNITKKAAGVYISGLTFTNGKEYRGGAIYIDAKDVTVDNCRFEKNRAEGSAGAICFVYKAVDGERGKIQNCYFKDNSAGTGAGALGAYSNKSQIINCTFESNHVEGSGDTYGGAIQVGVDTKDAYGTVRNCTFINNWAKTTSKDGIAHGGAGCVRTGSSYYECVFINNTAQHGGALTFHGVGVVSNCKFINNTATTMYGGGISIDLLHETMELSVVDSTFNGNKAPYGGAIRLSGMNIDIDNCSFDKNHAFIDGGAININAVTVNVEDSKFNLNTADNDGGALYLIGQTTVVSDCEFKNNSAIPDHSKLDDGLGGAIYVNSTKATITNNLFNYNTARNGSAVYYDRNGKQLTLKQNTMFQNQAWVYALPIYAKDIYYGETEKIGSVIHGGNNIAKYNNLAVSNAIYNAAPYSNIKIDSETPVSGATMSGELYQDDREYNMDILLTVKHEDGSVVYNKTLKSNYLGEVNDNLNNLKPGKYYVTATHYEDTYYKPITNRTTFIVKPKVDNEILKSVNPQPVYNYDDVVVWTLNIANNGPNNATGVVVRDVLPQGLTWLKDDSNGKYDPKTGVLTIGSLAVGQSVVVNIHTTVKKTGEITNKANVTGNEYDINLNNNRDEKSITVDPACDLQIVKSVNNTSPNFNDLVKWTLTVRNNGPDIAHEVNVKDTLPKGLIFISSDGDYNSNTGIWNIGTLAKGKEVKLNIISRVNATGTIKNIASVSGKEYDYDLSNNNDSDLIKVKKATDLAIVKTVNSSTANFGNLVKWTLTVTNNGPDAASGVKVSDSLPKGFVFVSAKPGKGSYSNGVFSVGNMAVGEKVVLEIVSRVNATGDFVNVADVSGNEYDYDLTNNRDDAKIKINPASDLEVQKTVNNTSPNFNDLVKWTLTVRNNGPDIAHEVKVKDMLPKGLIFLSAGTNYNSKTGIWDIGTLAKGKQVTLNIISRINATGTIKNPANVSGKEYDYDLSNNNDSEVVNVKKATDLAIVKSVNVTTADFGNLVKWTLTVSNNGPDAASGVKVSDSLPKGFVFVSAKPGKGSYSNGVFSVGNMAVGEKVVLEIVSRVNATGDFVNVADVSGNEYDYDLTNNRDDAKIKINPASDLEVQKTANKTSPNFNDLVKWTLTVKNNGPDTAHDVVVTDMLPKGLIWISDTSSGKYNHNTGKWDVGVLNIKQSKKIEIITRVNATGTINNNVKVTGKEYDYDLTNNNDSEIIKIPKSADVKVVKVVNETSPNYLNYVRWTVIASNNGPDAATNVNVTDVLPKGLILINTTATKGHYNNGKWSVGSLLKGESESLDIVCRINKTGKITNIATISASEYDWNKSNNKDDESIDVPLSVDLEVIKEVDNQNPYFGYPVTWLISVINHGPDDAEDVVVTDLISDNLIFENYTSTKGEYKDGKWFVGSLANGKVEYINITCIVIELGRTVNGVNVTSSQYDWNLINNYDDEFIDSNPVADLSLIKLVNMTEPNYGDLVRWTLLASNNGPNNASGVIVYDVLPEGLEFIESTDDEYINGIWEIGNMYVGETRQIDIICKVITTGDITNFANITGVEFDPDWENNYDEMQISVPPACDLAITKTVSKQHYYVGDVISYAIKLTNNGPDMAENIVVDEILDDALTLKSAKTSEGEFDRLTNTWKIDSLDVGDEAELLLEAVASEEGIFDNSVSASSDTYDHDLTNNDDSVSVDVTEKPENNTPTYEKQDMPKNDDNEIKLDAPLSVIAKNNVTGNPIVVLFMSLIFSLIFLGGNISKK